MNRILSIFQAGVPNYFEKKKFTYRRIPVYDSGTTDLLEYAPSVISFISNGLHYGSVLVHCQRGVSRSTTCVLFYLMNRVGMDFESAMELVKSRRECAEPIPAFITQLKSYEEQCIKSGLITKSREATSCNKELSSEIVNKSKKRKSVSIESQDKKVQGPKRPIGPSFPSSKSATSGMIEDNHDEKNKSAIVENDDSNPSKKKVKKNPDGKKRSIGPSLPPK